MMTDGKADNKKDKKDENVIVGIPRDHWSDATTDVRRLTVTCPWCGHRQRIDDTHEVYPPDGIVSPMFSCTNDGCDLKGVKIRLDGWRSDDG